MLSFCKMWKLAFQSVIVVYILFTDYIDQIEKRRSVHSVEHGQTESAMAAQLAENQVQGAKRRNDGMCNTRIRVRYCEL